MLRPPEAYWLNPKIAKMRVPDRVLHTLDLMHWKLTCSQEHEQINEGAAEMAWRHSRTGILAALPRFFFTFRYSLMNFRGDFDRKFMPPSQYLIHIAETC